MTQVPITYCRYSQRAALPLKVLSLLSTCLPSLLLAFSHAQRRRPSRSTGKCIQSPHTYICMCCRRCISGFIRSMSRKGERGTGRESGCLSHAPHLSQTVACELEISPRYLCFYKHRVVSCHDFPFLSAFAVGLRFTPMFAYIS